MFRSQVADRCGTVPHRAFSGAVLRPGRLEYSVWRLQSSRPGASCFSWSSRLLISSQQAYSCSKEKPASRVHSARGPELPTPALRLSTTPAGSEAGEQGESQIVAGKDTASALGLRCHNSRIYLKCSICTEQRRWLHGCSAYGRRSWIRRGLFGRGCWLS